MLKRFIVDYDAWSRSLEELADLDDCERCCARVMGKFYSDKRCALKKVEGDYCKKHSKRIKKFGYFSHCR